MADVDEVGMSLGAENSPRVGLEGTGSKRREAENCPVEQQKAKTMREQLAVASQHSVCPSVLMMSCASMPQAKSEDVLKCTLVLFMQ